jgi:hypothetical protein
MKLSLIPFTTLLIFLVFDKFIHKKIDGLNKIGLLEKILIELLVIIALIFTLHKLTTTNMLIVLNFIVIYAYLLKSNIYNSFRDLSKETFIFNKYTANSRRNNSNFYSLNNLYPDNVKQVDSNDFKTLAANEVPINDAQFYFDGETTASVDTPQSFSAAAADKVASTTAPNMIYAAVEEPEPEPEPDMADVSADELGFHPESVEVEENPLTSFPIVLADKLSEPSGPFSSFMIAIRNLFFP